MSFTNFKDIAKSKNQVITIQHVPSGKKVSFPAFLTNFGDSYSVSWGNEQIFGRQDPIKPYQSTTRTISIAFDVLAHDEASAKENLSNYSLLIKMLYPSYSDPLSGSPTSLGRTIKAPPIMRMKFVNMIQSPSGGKSLLGCIDGLEFSPKAESGYFYSTNGDLYPKHYNVSLKFTPQHEEILGWTPDGSFLQESFPYSAPAQGLTSGAGSGGVTQARTGALLKS